MTDEECWHAFGVEPKEGKPDDHEYDEEVVCTSYYSQFEPTENGEVHIRQVQMAAAGCLVVSISYFQKSDAILIQGSAQRQSPGCMNGSIVIKLLSHRLRAIENIVLQHRP